MTPEERDALHVELAERLFGAVLCPRCKPNSDIEPCDWPGGCVPDYAGTWEGCGLVLEAMRAREFTWELIDAYNAAGRIAWSAQIWDSVNAGSIAQTDAETLPEAVARAAIAALEAEASTRAGRDA